MLPRWVATPPLHFSRTSPAGLYRGVNNLPGVKTGGSLPADLLAEDTDQALALPQGEMDQEPPNLSHVALIQNLHRPKTDVGEEPTNLRRFGVPRIRRSDGHVYL